MYFLVYVDDLIVIGNNNIFLHKFLQDLVAKFSVKDLGDLHYFLGIEVLPTPFGLLLTQHKYIRDLLERINMVGSKACVPPLSTFQHLCLNDGFSPTDAYKFCQVINALQYFALTRPNISSAVNKLAQFMHCPSENHWSSINSVLRYLKSTIHHGLFIKQHQTLNLIAFTDADCTSNRDDRTSTSKKQKFVAHSSTTTEYQALASYVAEVLWVNNMLVELHVSCSYSPQIFCNNIGATYLYVNPIFHFIMKHISINYHFVCDHLALGSLRVSHVSSKDHLDNTLPIQDPCLQWEHRLAGDLLAHLH